jgi:hypothetical protein
MRFLEDHKIIKKKVNISAIGVMILFLLLSVERNKIGKSEIEWETGNK